MGLVVVRPGVEPHVDLTHPQVTGQNVCRQIGAGKVVAVHPAVGRGRGRVDESPSGKIVDGSSHQTGKNRVQVNLGAGEPGGI